jgi:tripartite-type tricarboxylate transporter receptor subunit TctC
VRRFQRERQTIRVLVISSSGFIRLALAHRLADIDAVVTLAEDGADSAFENYDAVVVGPYLRDVDRDRVVDELVASGSDAAVIEICDPPDNGSARLIALGDNRLADAAEQLLTAVGGSQGALAEA